MKKILILLILFQSTQAMWSSKARIPLKMPSSKKNQYLAFNAHTNFGKTHFIAGYKEPKQKAATEQKKINHDDEVITSKLVRRKKVSSDSAILIDESRLVQSFFTSRHNVRSIIATVLKQAQKSILIAAFTLTDPTIAQALLKAHKAGIKVEVITDYSNMNKPYSKIKELINGNIPVFYYNPALNPNAQQKNARFVPLMHLKLILCDNKIAITGSSNLTKAGQRGNIETITIIRDKQSIHEHVQEFDHLRPLCSTCQFLTNH